MSSERRRNPLTRGVKPFSRDRLMMVSRELAAKGAFTCLDHLQQEQPEVQVASAAVLFAVWADRLGIDPQELHLYGRKMIRAQQGHLKANIHVEVLRDFAGIRIAGDDRTDIR